MLFALKINTAGKRPFLMHKLLGKCQERCRESYPRIGAVLAVRIIEKSLEQWILMITRQGWPSVGVQAPGEYGQLRYNCEMSLATPAVSEWKLSFCFIIFLS